MVLYETNNLRKTIAPVGVETPDVSEVTDFNLVVEQLLLFHKGLHLKSGNDVVVYFNQHPGTQDRASFLQKEIYSKDVYCETSLSDGTHAGFRALDEGLELWVGGNAYTSATGRSMLSWSFVAEITARLIQEGRYGTHGQVVAAEKQHEAEERTTSSSETSQEDIDAVLVDGSGHTNGKYHIYEQFLKNQGAKENIEFLKNEYGSGGGTFFFPDGSRGYQSHDAKGISFTKRGLDGDKEILSWSQISKRLGELIAGDRYLSPTEKAKYPAYQEEMKLLSERTAICKKFISIIRDYNDFRREQKDYSAMVNQYVLIDCAGVFAQGRKKTGALRMGGDYILPLMRKALNDIIAADVGFNERCEVVLRDLDSPIAKALEPTAEELSRETRTVKEYRVAVGNKVWLDGNEFEVLSLNDDDACLSDVNFPLFTQDIMRDVLVEKLKESPRNDHLLRSVEVPFNQAQSYIDADHAGKKSLDSAIQDARQQTKLSPSVNSREDKEL